MSIKQIAPKLGATGRALVRELHLPLDVPKKGPLANLGVSQGQPDHAIAHHAHLQELVTELVSRHLVVTCYRVVSDLLPTCNPRFWPKSAI